MKLLLLALLGPIFAASPLPPADEARFRTQAEAGSTEPSPRAPYATRAQLERRAAEVVETDVVEAFEVGRTVQDRPMWGFRVRSHGHPTERKILVFAGIHPMEWISSEVALALLEDLAAHPIDGVEVVVVPLVNVDRRVEMETALNAGQDLYFRFNADGIDLNRDWAHNREPVAVWRHLLPGRYDPSPAGPLSQPETRALDSLAEVEDFDVVVSLHAFGGFFYHPWAGRFERMPPEDWKDHRRWGEIMAKGQGAQAYKVRQLARWGFFFRGHGMEVDHFYAEHGAQSWLIELTRSGLNPLRPATLRSDFRLYNPHNLDHHVEQGLSALRALVGTHGWEVRHGRPWPD